MSISASLISIFGGLVPVLSELLSWPWLGEGCLRQPGYLSMNMHIFGNLFCMIGWGLLTCTCSRVEVAIQQ